MIKLLIVLLLAGCGSESLFPRVEKDAEDTLWIFREAGGHWDGSMRFTVLDVFKYSGYESVAVCHEGEILINRDVFDSLGYGFREPALLHSLFHCSKNILHTVGRVLLRSNPRGDLDYFPLSIMTNGFMIPEDVYLLNREYYLNEIGM